MGGISVNMIREKWNALFPKDAETKRFWNWILVWIILANIGFMALWFVGAPPRFNDILVAGFIGMVVKRFPFWVRFISFAAFITWSVLKFICGLFNLSLWSLSYSIRFIAEMNPSTSMEYVGVGIALLVILVVAFVLLRRDANFSRSALVVLAGVMILSLTGLDIYMGRDMRGHYFRNAPEGAAFASARSISGFAAKPDHKRNLVLIIVESMGAPHNPEMQKLLFAQYKNSATVRARYDIHQGIAPFYNSTTSGEMRELCGRWGDYYDLLEKNDGTCLPAILAKQGYATDALHSFTGNFFKREIWYPHIGFGSRDFQDDLHGEGARYCGGVFPGICDRDVPHIMAQKLKAAKQPTFLYWLTLNSHLPVPPGLNLNVDHCERISAYLAREFPQVCRQFAIWNDIDVSMVNEITASDFPDTDFLIVGDHMPPFFDKHNRIQFDPEHVSWLYLHHKDSAASH